MARHGGYRRIYRDNLTGHILADDTPVFGRGETTVAGMEDSRMYPQHQQAPQMGFDYNYGAYDQLGSEFEMGFYDGGFGQKPLSRNVGLPQRQMVARPQPTRQMPARQSAGKWQKTVLVGVSSPTTAGAYNIAIRPQYDFVAQDMTFTGTTALAGAVTVTSVIFGDHVILNVPNGLPIAVVAVGGFIRGLIKGGKIRGGLDITVTGNQAGGAGVIYCTIVGLKPQDTCAQI